MTQKPIHATDFLTSDGGLPITNPPLLSICIATLNRARYLREMLDDIAGQLAHDVEIVIVDGASTDETPDVVHGFISKIPRLRYLRLPCKGGIDLDYCRAVEIAQGRYCWLLTDDDRLAPRALVRVLSCLSSEPSLLILNASVHSSDYSRCLQELFVDAKEDREFGVGEQEECFRVCIRLLSFIGSVVIRRDLLTERDRDSYLGTEFVHVGVIFQRPFPETVKFIAEPLVAIRYGMGHWACRAFEIWEVKWRRLLHSFSWLSPGVVQRAGPFDFRRMLTATVLHRGIGSFDRSKVALIEGLWPTISVCLARLIAWVPPSWCNLAMYGYLFCRGHLGTLSFYDIEHSRWCWFRPRQEPAHPKKVAA